MDRDGSRCLGQPAWRRRLRLCFGVEEAGGVGALVSVDDGEQLSEGGVEGGLVAFGDGGAHEDAVVRS